MGEPGRVYPYIPNSVPEIKAQMLREVGASDISDLFEEIPAHLRFKGRLQLPDPILDEFSLRKHVEGQLARNANCDEINGRGEFLTAYVGESYADHGKWQAFFEYCSLMGDLLDMDVMSCPLYDGGQAAASSVRMAARITGRSQVVIPSTMSPDVRLVLQNYCMPDIAIVEVGFDRGTGLLDLADLSAKVTSDTAAVLIENPSYLGFLESQAAEVGEVARAGGAEFVVYTDPISLGVMAPPAQYGATIACGDFQPLGMHMQAGGGQGGFIATGSDMRYVSEFKDLMFGITETVREGEYGFGEVLFERTSYGSREKGNEYTGTTTGLWAITAAVYLSLMGPKGMRETGQTIMQMSQYAARRIGALNGVELGIGTPFFKEFVVNFDGTGSTVKKINDGLLERKIFGGKDLSGEFPDYGQSALYCVTETKTKDDVDALVGALEEVI